MVAKLWFSDDVKTPAPSVPDIWLHCLRHLEVDIQGYLEGSALGTTGPQQWCAISRVPDTFSFLYPDPPWTKSLKKNQYKNDCMSTSALGLEKRGSLNRKVHQERKMNSPPPNIWVLLGDIQLTSCILSTPSLDEWMDYSIIKHCKGVETKKANCRRKICR